MHFMWFTERAYHYDPEEDLSRYNELETDIVRRRSFFGTPNRLCRPCPTPCVWPKNWP